MRFGRKTVSVHHGDALSRVSWQDFEHRIAQHFRGLGYRVEHTGTGGSAASTDGGIDLKVYRDQEYIVVQCKHWNVFQVPHNDVHQLIGVMQTERATGALIVTSGEFTRAAIDAGTKYPRITLVDGVMVRNMLGFIPEPLQPVISEGMDTGWRRPARRRRRDAAPVVTAVAKLAVTAVTLPGLYGYYTHTIERAAATLDRVPVATVAARMTNRPQATERAVPPPITRPDGRAVHLDTTPSTDSDLAEWKRKNAQAMRILEKTTPEL